MNTSEKLHLFPLPDAVFEHAAHIFSDFTPEELTMIEEDNLLLLPPDSPDRWLLEARMRPELVDTTVHDEYSETTLAAYRAGACVGIAALHRQMRLLAARGYRSHGLLLDSGQLHVVAESNKTEPYLATKSSIALIGLLERAWERNGLPFMMSRNQGSAPDYVLLGVRDALSLYGTIYQD